MKETVYLKFFGPDKHQVFWAICVRANTYTVRQGKIGSKGRTKTETLESPKVAASEARKLIREKNREGYRPVSKSELARWEAAAKHQKGPGTTPKSTTGKGTRTDKVAARNRKLEIRAEDVMNQVVRTPFCKQPVQVIVEIDKHPGLLGIANWGDDLKKQIEEACFASYRDKVEAIGLESLPRIRKPNEVWKHLAIRNIRIDPSVPDALVVYVVPKWDEEEHMEWCIKNNKLVFVGQFLGYSVGGYAKGSPGNHA